MVRIVRRERAIAVATPPKSNERLDTAQSDLKVDFRRQPETGIAESAEDAVEAKSEILAQPPSSEAGKIEIEVSAAEQPVEAREDAPGSTAKDAPTKGESAGSELPGRRATAPPPESDSGTGNAAPYAVPVSTEPRAQQLALAPEQHAFEGHAAAHPSGPHPKPERMPSNRRQKRGASRRLHPAQMLHRLRPKPRATSRRKGQQALFSKNIKGSRLVPAQADAARAARTSAQTSSTRAVLPRSPTLADEAPRNEVSWQGQRAERLARRYLGAFRQRAVKKAMAQDQLQSTAASTRCILAKN